MTRRRGLPRALAALAAVAAAILIAGCGSFDSKASGEHLIKDYFNKFGKNQVTVKSVSCPSGVAEKVGTSYDCKITLHNVQNGASASGTVTIHIAKGNKVEILGGRDIHINPQ